MPLPTAAEVLADSLINAGVEIVFGIPGAKVDAVFNELLDHPKIKLIVCRHEQNAAFMAQAIGRLTGRPGVCVATSGPGATNLITAMATANTEGDPLVALVGSVPRTLTLVKTHQNLPIMDIMKPVSKKVASVEHEDQVAEAVLNAFRLSMSAPQGVTAIDLPMDIMASGVPKIGAFESSMFDPPRYGPASHKSIQALTKLIDAAKLPVFLLGMRASEDKNVAAIHAFLKRHAMPVVETFQAAGSISRDLLHLFYGRLGLFRNQPGDRLLAHSDLVITIGFDPVEYDPPAWNPRGTLNIVHIDVQASDPTFYYKPNLELIGSIDETLLNLAEEVSEARSANSVEFCEGIARDFHAWTDTEKAHKPTKPGATHPLHFISTLQSLITDDTIVCCDIGTVYIWMCRYFFSYKPRHFLVSNGQQTLGVALPWAIAASLLQSPNDPSKRKKVISISGDGGFMFTSQELTTAVLQGCDITHFVWNDSSYNMVAIQEEVKYGRRSGVELGGVDFAKFAEACGATGGRVEQGMHLEKFMRDAIAHKGVMVVDVPIDYSDNGDLMSNVVPADVN